MVSSGGSRSFGRRLGALVRVATSEPVVALTFDDGPDPHWTPALLDVLGRNAAQATFFLDGPAAEREPALARRLADEGHAIGLHGWAHQSAAQVDALWGVRAQVADIRKCARAVGAPTRLYRPPYGHESPWTRVASIVLGYQLVYWSASVEDWTPTSPSALADALVRAFEPGAIVLLHDGLRHAADPAAFDRGYLVEAVEHALRQVAGRISFVTVPDLLSHGAPVTRLRRRFAPPLPPMAERQA